METKRTENDYQQAFGSLLHRMKGIRYWEIIGDLSGTELAILHTIAGSPEGSMQVGELTETLSMHPTSVSRLMNSLEEKGYIERSLHKGNRRITDVSLTESGRQKVDDDNRILNDFWRTVLSGMKKEDLKSLLRVSGELFDRMEDVFQERKISLKKA